ncbi:hypothetical protein A2574_04165 [Candidatus Shapirobacteria bacterium RIFOXYD1_FULL_38_32]|uniref:Uncharacterized protein n=3 Tax=Candidatus Shapironibacteriota TaxID=1752721 RepID=A0A0G0MZV6_9BACT|nr:MAG: hypothetical protein US90_C0007G0009 [Candidatus Shapirobacteria bacterium GW2011_GWE2_38_30]KKQ92317.1 MAG: hypothetical protein UT14_C0005G0014 [Candidatus Shapirobacteria bacterium GW2011_GWE1_38_92]OGL56189.1 MAG: hypothetical protein A2410_00025 [Candidatus Shapirobacteria bacterium RIFOXYC1_FULL_38_24]OGL56724.1 MAG: hypothetical protein A2367_03570 [Candidatus Shapirobacteria bacterium RIFOXYB1_FULL_38_38]OGL56778.1 MAG: hypothetical protein A2195_00120 [Candidatus Shapirobacteri
MTNIKKVLPLIVLLVILSSNPAFAQDQDRLNFQQQKQDYVQIQNQDRDQVQIDKQDATATMAQERQQNREQIKATITQAKQQRNTFWNQIRTRTVNFYFGNIKNKLTNQYELRLRQKEYLDTRLATLKNESDKDYSSVEAKLNQFEQFRQSFQDDFAVLEAKFNELTSVEDKNPGEIISELRSLTNRVNQDLRNMRSNLLESLKLMLTINR